jgi:N-acetylmuramoyl-L-alanine amidase
MVTLLLDTGSPQRGYREIERVTSPVEFPVLVSFLLNLQESSCSICIDAGHGGIDHGTTASHDGTDITEAELNQKMVRLIYDEVMKIEDCRPFLVKATVSPRGERSYPFAAGSTRDAKRQDLRTRPQLCEEKGGKCLFVSLHHNAADSRRARGTEVFYFDPDRRLRENPPAEEKRFIEDNLEALRRKRDHSKACAHKLSDCITEVYTRFDREWRNRGAKYNDLTVIERGPTDMPAVLAELGFVTNPDDLAVLVNERAQKAVARAIAGCVCQCCREARDIDAPLPA